MIESGSLGSLSLARDVRTLIISEGDVPGLGMTKCSCSEPSATETPRPRV